MFEIADYRKFLKEKLAERCHKNPSYSLRSFARDLKIPASRLSEVLSRKSGLTVSKANTIAVRLGLNKDEKDWFMTLVEATDGRARKKRYEASIKMQCLQKLYGKYHQVNLDQFKIISDWYHFAIVDLVATHGFQKDPQWISKRLGISKVEVDLALERLLRLGLLREHRGKLEAIQDMPSTPTDVPSEAIRNFHRQILQKAVQALEFQTVEERDFSAITAPIAKSLLPEAKQKIENFRREFNHWAQENKVKKDEVYSLSIQFFNLSKEIK